MRFAIFDLDHTLLPMDCEWGWVQHIARCEGLDPKIEFAPLKPLYEAFFVTRNMDYAAFDDFQMRFLARFPRRRLDALMSEYIDETVVPAIPEQSKTLVASHRDAGDRMAICSGAYSYIVRPIARCFGIETFLCAEPEVDCRGEFTGRLLGEHSFSENKVKLVKRYLEQEAQKGEHFEKLFFYSDSINDKPLFEFVAASGGECVTVNADKELAQLAQDRSWKTLRLYEPEDYAALRSYTIF